MFSALELFLTLVHHLSGAAWFGALIYRLLFVDPRARQYLGAGAEYERFSLHLADGMRLIVLMALLVCGGSGFALLGMRGDSLQPGWETLITGKIILWGVACGVFYYISWVFWPRRVFAIEKEYRSLHRQAIVLSVVMIGLAGLGLVLGQLAQLWRVSGPT